MPSSVLKGGAWWGWCGDQKLTYKRPGPQGHMNRREPRWPGRIHVMWINGEQATRSVADQHSHWSPAYLPDPIGSGSVEYRCGLQGLYLNSSGGRQEGNISARIKRTSGSLPSAPTAKGLETLPASLGHELQGGEIAADHIKPHMVGLRTLHSPLRRYDGGNVLRASKHSF